jgi:16S rRNA (guanine527-N7)-methyltransferase
LAANARALDLDLAAEILVRFEAYQRELLNWNQRINLTAIRDPGEVQVKHFADSLAVLDVLPTGPLRLLDVGTGAGFPGVPLRLVRPSLELTLVDSIGKKTAFLEHLVLALQLEDTRVVTGRAEDLGRQPSERETYDVVVSRAVASLATLVELCLPLARVGGLMVAQKKAGIDDEIRAASRAITLVGGKLRPIDRYRLPDLDEERWLIVVEKVWPTARAYPRRPGVPAKSPL